MSHRTVRALGAKLSRLAVLLVAVSLMLAGVPSSLAAASTPVEGAVTGAGIAAPINESESFSSSEFLVKLDSEAKGQVDAKLTDKKSRSLRGATGIGRFDDALGDIAEITPLLPAGKQVDDDHRLAQWYKLRLSVPLSEEPSTKGSDAARVGRLEKIFDKLAKTGSVEKVQPNYEMKLEPATTTYNDPYLSSTNSFGQGAGISDLWGIHLTNAPLAWDTTTGAGMLIAVVDTGLDVNHPELAGQVWVNPNETPGNNIDDDANGFVDDINGWNFCQADSSLTDTNGHGTLTAGAIVAKAHNSIGIAGVAPNAKVLPIKLIACGGTTYTDGTALAMYYAVDEGAKVINNSWIGGGAGLDATLADAFAYAHDHGTVVVFAAGNDSEDALYANPNTDAQVITVSASGPSDDLMYFSNTGSKIDVAAPGGEILTLKSSVATCSHGQVGAQYCNSAGTSLAAPYVSGAAALVMKANPALSPEEVRQVLRQSAYDAGAPGRDDQFGFGRLDIGAAVALATSQSHILAPIITSPAQFSTQSPGTITITGSIPGPNFASYKLEVGDGQTPSTWQTLTTSTTQVMNGTLGTVTAPRSNWYFAIRLTVTDTAGKTYEYRINSIKVPTPDTTPGFATMTTPINNAWVQYGVTSYVTAYDPESGIKRVHFYINSIGITPSWGSSYTDSVNDDQYYAANFYLPNSGTYRITATAINGENMSTYTDILYISNNVYPAPRPTVAINSPASNATVGDSVTVNATATDSTNGMNKVQFKVDGTTVATVTGSGPSYSTTIDMTPYAAGAHVITARAISAKDPAGFGPWEEASVTVQRQVGPDMTGPSVAITSHSTGSYVKTPGELVMSSTATDPSGVASVVLTATPPSGSSSPTFTQTLSSAPWSASFPIDYYTNASYTLTAVATDSVGNSSTATVSGVNIGNDHSLPNCTITSVTGSGNSRQVNVTVSESGGSGLDHLEYQLNGYTQMSQPVSGTGGSYSGTLDVSGATGDNSVTVVGFDNQGNHSDCFWLLQLGTGDTSPPTTPGALSLASGLNYPNPGATDITIAWGSSSDNVGVTGYEIYRNGSYLTTVSGPTLSYKATGLSTSTAYAWKVRAKDSAGNFSAFTTTYTASTTPSAISGLNTSFWNNTSLSGSPVFRRVDSTVAFNWSTGAPASGVNTDGWSARLTSRLQVNTAATYTIYTNSDDGVRLWIDGTLLINDWNNHGMTENSAQVYLTNARHDLVIEYYDSTQSAGLELRWSSPSLTKQLVGSNAFFAPPVTGLTGKYYANASLTGTPVTRIDSVVDFDWASGSPMPAIPTDTFSVRWTGVVQVPADGTYTFFTNSNDGARLWVNGQQLVNDWQNQGLTENFGALYLQAGHRYTITYEFYENTNTAAAQLKWAGPGITKTIVPSSALSSY